mmetsp:Transcript_28562/g.46042  ORF Transcript_28562/g.46042 Transcript_28562/m.46042 type:complete len:97 (+) Transcript_28562:2293-2583(+)
MHKNGEQDMKHCTSSSGICAVDAAQNVHNKTMMKVKQASTEKNFSLDPAVNPLAHRSHSPKKDSAEENKFNNTTFSTRSYDKKENSATPRAKSKKY